MRAGTNINRAYLPVRNTLLIAQPSKFMGDAIAVMYNITPLQSHLNTGHFSTRNWYALNSIFTDMKSDAFAVRRTKAQAEAGGHLVFVHRYASGSVRGRLGDLSMDRDPGSVYLLDQTSRLECIQFPNHTQGVFLPKSLLGFDPDMHAPLIRFPNQHAVGDLLDAQLSHIFRGLTHNDTVDIAAYYRLVACLRTALGSDTREGDVRRHARDAMAELICAFIEQRLGDWSLSVGSILTNFGVSRASLFRMFENNGGVRQYINDRRIYRAVLEISEGPLQRGQIASTAEKWGFSSDASFNRAVRREFGVTPGSITDLRAADRRQLKIDRAFQHFVVGARASVHGLVDTEPARTTDPAALRRSLGAAS